MHNPQLLNPIRFDSLYPMGFGVGCPIMHTLGKATQYRHGWVITQFDYELTTKTRIPPRKARDGTATTKPCCRFGGRFCRGRPFLERPTVRSIETKLSHYPLMAKSIFSA